MAIIGLVPFNVPAMGNIVLSIFSWVESGSDTGSDTDRSDEYDRLLKKFFDIFVRLDQGLTVVEVGEDTEELLGFSEGSLEGKRLDRLFETHNFRELKVKTENAQSSSAIKLSDYMVRSSEPSIPVEIKLVPDEDSTDGEFFLVGRDLRDEIELEENLLKREEQFRQLARNLDAIFWMRDIEGNALYVSPQYEQIWERSLEAFENDVNAYTDAIIEEDYERVRNAIPDMQTGEYDIEYRIETPDGTQKWIHDRAFPIRDADGEVYRVGGIAEDITEQKTLREKYKQVFHNVNDAIAIYDPETIEMVDCNRTYSEILGYSREEILEMGLEGYAATDEGYTRDRAEEIITELLETDRFSRSFDWVVRTADGERRVFEVNATLADIAGNQRLLTISRDITDRKRDKQKIEFQRELLEVIMETSNEGVLAINEDREIIAYNDRFQEIWELPDSVMEADTNEAALNEAQKRVKNPEQFRRDVEEAYQSPDERIVNELQFRDGRIIKQYSRSMTHGGDYHGRVWYFQDVTDERETQKRLESSLKEKEMLLKEIHHRVKNNMQVISSLLNLQFDPIDDPELQDSIEDTLNRIQSMAITHEMLYQSDDFGALDLNAYLEQLVQHLFKTHSGEAPNVDYSLTIDDVKLPLQQAISCGLVVTELVTNSLQHGFDGDESGTVEIEFQERTEASELIVRDNGSGLPADYDTGGDSLGLKLVESLVRSDLEGEYNITSEGGTEVSVRFELKPQGFLT